MSITGFVQAYFKPSRWWRRRKSIEITVWPQFLAQALCPHIHRQAVMWDIENRTITYRCIDCHKHTLVANPCGHSRRVSPYATERFAGMTTPRSYLCEDCGMELQSSELPRDAKVVYPPYKAQEKA